MSVATAMLDEALAIALEGEKSLFLARNAERCGHLLVRYRAEHDAGRLVITVAFTLGEVRRWQQAEAVVSLHRAADGAGYQQRVGEAFARLDEGIGTARIASLFAPLSAARRMANGRQ